MSFFKGRSGKTASGKGTSSRGTSNRGTSSRGTSNKGTSGRAHRFDTAVFHPVGDSNDNSHSSSSRVTQRPFRFGTQKATRYNIAGLPRNGNHHLYRNRGDPYQGFYMRNGQSSSSDDFEKEIANADSEGFESFIDTFWQSIDSWIVGITVAIIVFFVLIVATWVLCRWMSKKKRRRAQQKIAESLDASGWGNQKQIGFNFSQAGTQQDLDRDGSETSDSGNQDYPKKGPIEHCDSELTSSDSGTSRQSSLGDDGSRFFALELDEPKRSKNAYSESQKKNKKAKS